MRNVDEVAHLPSNRWTTRDELYDLIVKVSIGNKDTTRGINDPPSSFISREIDLCPFPVSHLITCVNLLIKTI